MAARKKAAKKRGSGGQGATAGVVRFKTGFPAGIRNAIRQRFGDNWHLSLQILDGDDGDGDDGDGDDGSADGGAASRAASRGGSAKKRTRTSTGSRGRGK
jgi:hypothetical protein